MGSPRGTKRAHAAVRHTRRVPEIRPCTRGSQEKRPMARPLWSQVVAVASGLPPTWSQSGVSDSASNPVAGPLSCGFAGAPRGIRIPNRQIRSLVTIGNCGQTPWRLINASDFRRSEPSYVYSPRGSVRVHRCSHAWWPASAHRYAYEPWVRRSRAGCRPGTPPGSGPRPCPGVA
jgi:hypothetical protein